MEKLPFETEVARDAVGGVAGDGKVDRGEMDADLMRSPRLEANAQKRVARQELLEFEVRHGRPRRVGVEGMAEPVVAVTSDRRVDRSAPGARLAHDQREVLARQGPATDETLQLLVRLVRARDHEQSRRVPVEAMDDSRPILLPALGPCGRERLCERASGVTGRGVHHDTGGLVHDEEVLVLVRDGELGRRDVRLRRNRRRRLDLDRLSARELVALFARLSVDAYGFRREKPLGRRA